MATKKRSRPLENQTPLYLRYENFDTNEGSSDEERTAQARHHKIEKPKAVEEGSLGMATNPFGALLAKCKEKADAEMKASTLPLYTLGFLKYNMYLQNFRSDDGDLNPPKLCPETDSAALAADKKEIIQAHADYLQFKKLLPECKKKLYNTIHAQLADAQLQRFHTEMTNAKELHVASSPKAALVLKTRTGHERICFRNIGLQKLFILAHVFYYFEAYAQLKLEEILIDMAKQIEGVSFCSTWNMIAAERKDFVPVLQPLVSDIFAFIKS
ncbi:MAG: hypothetical protein K2Q45_06790 [Nitrosomonas sp.]|nr:hypothetical protein [Nitrosomonas sp.]